MPEILPTIACNLDRNILTAALPLFQGARVQAMEWAFDSLYMQSEIPLWFESLLHTFAEAGRLVGHGVYFSIFAGKWSAEQEKWLIDLEELAGKYPFDHVTEHFGFMTGADFHTGAPLSVPYTPTTLAIGQDRLRRIQQAAQCPVGLENLAFAYTPEEVWRQGDFLDRLLSPVNGFLILDLHNLYCQLHNFQLTFENLVQAYPLQRVREIHISGGSWETTTTSPDLLIRRDTHDDRVPEEVFELLSKALPMLPNLKYVVLEQLGLGLKTIEQQNQFRHDFNRMSQILESFSQVNTAVVQNHFEPQKNLPASRPTESLALHKDQEVLSYILEQSQNHIEAQSALSQSRLAGSAWQVERWSPEMLDTALQIAQKWKKGSSSVRNRKIIGRAPS